MGLTRAKPNEPPVRAWIEAHQAGVWHYLRYLGCPADLADDLLQETLLAALAQREATAIHTPASWLRTTARNLYRMHLRRQGRVRATPDLDALDATWRELTGGGDGDGYRAALRSCLARLDGRGRLAIEMRYDDGLSRQQIAARLGLRPEGVKSLLQRVRQLLRDCIRRATGCGDET